MEFAADKSQWELADNSVHDEINVTIDAAVLNIINEITSGWVDLSTDSFVKGCLSETYLG